MLVASVLLCGTPHSCANSRASTCCVLTSSHGVAWFKLCYRDEARKDPAGDETTLSTATCTAQEAYRRAPPTPSLPLCKPS